MRHMRTGPRRLGAVGILAALTLLLLSSPAVAQSVIGEPEITVAVSDNRIDPNTKTTLHVALSNGGEIERGGPEQFERRVQTARNLRLRVPESGLPGDSAVDTGTVTIGSLPPGATPDPIPITIDVGDLEPGRYRIPVDLSFDFTRSVEYQTQPTEFHDSSRDQRRYVTVVVEDEARFAIATERGQRPIVAGDTAMVNLSLTNTGSRTGQDARLELTSQNPDLYFGDPTSRQGSTTLFRRALEPGSTRRMATQIGADADLAPGEYPVDARVTFENAQGATETSRPLQFGVAVAPEHALDVDLTAHRLRVDEDDGVLRGTVTNVGDRSLRNAVLRLSAQRPLSVTGPEAAVGDLAPGESADVRFDVAVPESATPGRRDVTIDVVYDNARDEERRFDEPIRRQITVGPQIDDFAVDSVETDLTAGGSATVTVDIRNAAGVPVEDANAKLFVNDPLSTSDDETFLGAMAPNETATATFTVSATGSAIPKEYAASLQVRYDDVDNETDFSDDVDLGVPVEEGGGGPPIAALVVVALLAGAAALYVRRR